MLNYEDSLDYYFVILLDKVKSFLDNNSTILARNLLLNNNLVYFEYEDNNFVFRFQYSIEENKYGLIIDAVFCTKNKIYVIPEEVSVIYIDNCESIYKYYNDMGSPNIEEPNYFCSFIYESFHLCNIHYCNESIDKCGIDSVSYYSTYEFILDLCNYKINRVPLLELYSLEVSSKNICLLNNGFHYDYVLRNKIHIDINDFDVLKYLNKILHLVLNYSKLSLYISSEYKGNNKLENLLILLKSVIKQEGKFISQDISYDIVIVLDVGYIYLKEPSEVKQSLFQYSSDDVLNVEVKFILKYTSLESSITKYDEIYLCL